VRRVALALAVTSAACPLQAQQDTLYLRTLASNCAQCHGTEGRTAPGSALPRSPASRATTSSRSCRAFKAGTRTSTIMQQLARGYSRRAAGTARGLLRRAAQAMRRRALLHAAAAAEPRGLRDGARSGHPRVIVGGGGYGGATAAKYMRMLSERRISVVLVEPNADFVSCPLSNLVVGGSRQLSDITSGYDGWCARASRSCGTRCVRSTRSSGRSRWPAARASATRSWCSRPASTCCSTRSKACRARTPAAAWLQAWKAGPETVALRRQLEAMPMAASTAITIPEQPYRCPPGPYERACQVAWYFKAAKPRSKVLVLDANPDVVSKAAAVPARVGRSSTRAWSNTGPQPQGARGRRACRRRQVRSAGRREGRRAQRAAADARRRDRRAAGPEQHGGQALVRRRLPRFESSVAKGIHVGGRRDPGSRRPCPRAGHMANAHAKVAAAAIVAELSGWPVNPAPMLTNTCYSFVDDQRVIHVASVHEYVAAERTYKAVGASGGVSAGPNELEGRYAMSWARNIWSDTLT
jgi:hypothetical protein